MKTVLPESNEDLRKEIYAGEIFRLPATPESQALVDRVNGHLAHVCKGVSLRRIHETFTYSAVAEKIAPVRRALSKSAECHDLLRSLITANGVMPQENAFDIFRLRCVFHEGHKSPGSTRAYALHRDTWFGNPQNQINWWIPLHDVSEEDSFAFYQECFSTPLDNTSAQFDYNEWMRIVGWQGEKGGSYDHYPSAPAAIPPRKGFAARAGEILLFSAAHLHGTCRNETGLTRWSIDFRTVHLEDFRQGRCAPNADNGSQPLALNDYVRTAP